MPAIRFSNADNLLRLVAAELFETYREKPLRLGDAQILIPETSQSHTLRSHLLEYFDEQQALLTPRTSTLQDYITAQTPPDNRILNNHGQELMLVEVLQEHGYSWQLADELLRWFEALELSNQHPDQLHSQLMNSGFSGFDEDATKLAILWKAWQTQLSDENATTRSNQYRKGLSELTVTQPLYIIGYDWLHELELTFVQRHINTNLTIWAQPDQPLYQQLHSVNIPFVPMGSEAQSARTEALNVLFRGQGKHSLLERCADWKTQSKQAFKDLKVFAAANPETEAIAIDRQVRYWIHAGKRNIAVITEDRRLARRASAILRRAGIAIHDEAGWPLSTTTAAGIVERWLEAIETDFAHQPLLDVLKTGFIHTDRINPQVVYRFQQDIIEREQVPAQITRYRTAIEQRRAAIPGDSQSGLADCEVLLDFVETAAAPLQCLKTQRHAPDRFVRGLQESLQKIGLWDGFQLDAAGQRITQELIDMEQATKQRSLNLSWIEFRAWFGRALETHNFRPGRNPSGVSMLNLEQSRLGDYDAIMLAGAGEKQLPGPAPKHIFFNDSARYALKLKTRDTARQLSFYRFRRLLEATRDITISYTAFNNNEPQLPSPWVNLLHSFALATEDNNLEPEILTHLVNSPDAAIDNPDPLLTPKPPKMAAPNMPNDLMPRRLSASAHQNLIECPYRYFASYGLGLRARDEIIEQLTKREFGNIVHAALQNFYSGGDDLLPGPFNERISMSNRETAVSCLLDIGRRLLDRVSAAGFEHRAWHHAWNALANGVIDWEIRHNGQWHNHANEVELTLPIPETDISIYGKIDRIDRKLDEERVIDYKTGAQAAAKLIEKGENVQLLTYALLDTSATEAQYLPLKPNEEVKAKKGVAAADIDGLREETMERLTLVLKAMNQGAEMPANGDAKTACKYCDLDGLCRTQLLAETTE